MISLLIIYSMKIFFLFKLIYCIGIFFQKAVEKYDQVVEILEFTKELRTQFQSVINDVCL